MTFFDGTGKDVGLFVNNYISITKVLGHELPTNIDTQKTYNISQSYANTLVSAIKEWMTEYSGDRNKIPLILHTDQHGRLSQPNSKGIFSLINDIVNWNEISKVLNLGDVVTDHWDPDYTNVDIFLRNEQLEKANDTLSIMPSNKQIHIFGNHDTWCKNEEGILDKIDLKYLQPYFNNSTNNIRIDDNSGNFVVYDDNFNVKYLVIADWGMEDEYSQYRYQQLYIYSKYWDWMIKQMEENDGYDIIILSHIPLLLDHSVGVDPITGTPSTQPYSPLHIDDRSPYNYTELFTARKNKTSGTFTDPDGVIHNYNFTNCKGNLLCSLAGHTHYDEYQYINDSLLVLAHDWFHNQTLFLSLVDRIDNKIKVWKVSNDDAPKTQTYILNI